MNAFKKVIGTALAALMIGGCGTLTFAKNYDDVDEDYVSKNEISILSDIGVIKGTSENEFSPDENVTREQMAAFLFRLMLGRDDAGRVNTSGFEDLYEPYYNGAISWANAAGYIKGVGGSRFNPTGGITKQDAMTMLVRALGQETEKMNSGYPWSYINAGIKLGLDRGLNKVGYDETLTRGETAIILYNALTSEYLVARNATNGNIYYESTSIIEEVFGYKIAETVLVATNNYAIEGETVIKDGYVTLKAENDDKNFNMTVSYSSMNLTDVADKNLGMSYRVIYKEENGKFDVLSAVAMSSAKDYTTVEIDSQKDNVKIGENVYTLVEEYSDKLSTNNNELKLYAYDDDGKLALIKNTKELKSLLGFYRVTLLCDSGNEVADRAVLRVFNMDVLNVTSDGKVNLAANKYEDDLNIINNDKAVNGDHVLYYYNPETSELEIATVLDIVSGRVNRLSLESAKIDDDTYALGNEAAGISSESIREKISLGNKVSAVVYNGMIVDIVEGVTVSTSSKYILALSDAEKVYENGSFKYVMDAFVNGEEKTVFVKNSVGEAGNIYRYTETDGVYALIPMTSEDGIILSGKDEFIQNSNGVDEIAYAIDSAKDTVIELNGKNYYSIDRGNADSISSVRGLDGVKFVFDENSTVVVVNNGRVMFRTGEYSSTINVNDGAKVIAVFDNEVGTVETLKYLYISDGSLGNYDINAEFVRILAENGLVYENGSTYAEYLVYNYTTGKVETKLSIYTELEVGEDYRCGSDQTVTSDKANAVQSGFVTGYTTKTVSIAGETFTLSEDVRVIRINSKNEIEELKVSDLYMNNVDFVANRGEITLLIEGKAPKFESFAIENTIVVSADFDFSDFSELPVKVISMTFENNDVSVEGFEAKFSLDNKIDVELPEGKTLDAGKYTITLEIGGKNFTTSFEVAEKSE